jgi:hypothetical protein
MTFEGNILYDNHQNPIATFEVESEGCEICEMINHWSTLNHQLTVCHDVMKLAADTLAKYPNVIGTDAIVHREIIGIVGGLDIAIKEIKVVVENVFGEDA